MHAPMKVAIPRLMAAWSIETFIVKILLDLLGFTGGLEPKNAPDRCSDRVPDKTVRRTLCENLRCRCRTPAQCKIVLASRKVRTAHRRLVSSMAANKERFDCLPPRQQSMEC